MSTNTRHLCPCGSGKRLKACCKTPQQARKLQLEHQALALAAQGRHVEACAAFEQRVALSPANPMIWNDLGNHYAAAGDYPKAFTALKRATSVDATYPLPLFNLGKHMLDHSEHLLQAGDKAAASQMVEEAIGYLEASLARDPASAACHQVLADACRRAGDPSRAARHLAEAIRLDPTLAQAQGGLQGTVLRLLGRFGTRA